MITIGTIIGLIASNQGVAAMIEGIAGSYIANHLPILTRHPDFDSLGVVLVLRGHSWQE